MKKSIFKTLGLFLIVIAIFAYWRQSITAKEFSLMVTLGFTDLILALDK